MPNKLLHGAWLAVLVCLCGFLSACGTANQARTGAGEARNPEPPPQAYVRIAGDGSNVFRLELAIRHLKGPKKADPEIWLCAASHIGEPAYYDALQDRLAEPAIVLFEGISSSSSEENNGPTKQDSGEEDSSAQRANAGSLQSNLASALDLVFQLEALDYDQANFKNSDLSIEELRSIFAKSSEQDHGGGPAFETLLSTMQGSSFLNSLLQLGLKFIAASPRFQTLAKLVLLELLGQSEGDPNRLGPMPASIDQLLKVLLERRNERVMEDVRSEVTRFHAPNAVAVLYGAGHMKDLETRLRHELGYRPSGEEWIEAFSVDLGAAGISAAEKSFVDSLIKSQVNPAKKATKD